MAEDIGMTLVAKASLYDTDINELVQVIASSVTNDLTPYGQAVEIAIKSVLELTYQSWNLAEREAQRRRDIEVDQEEHLAPVERFKRKRIPPSVENNRDCAATFLITTIHPHLPRMKNPIAFESKNAQMQAKAADALEPQLLSIK